MKNKSKAKNVDEQPDIQAFLDEWLNWGDLTEVSQKTGKSISAISRMRKGERTFDKTVKAALIKIANDNRNLHFKTLSQIRG